MALDGQRAPSTHRGAGHGALQTRWPPPTLRAWLLPGWSNLVGVEGSLLSCLPVFHLLLGLAGYQENVLLPLGEGDRKTAWGQHGAGLLSMDGPLARALRSPALRPRVRAACRRGPELGPCLQWAAGEGISGFPQTSLPFAVFLT